MTLSTAIFAFLATASSIAAAPALERTVVSCINPGTGTGPVRSDWKTTLIGDGNVSQRIGTGLSKSNRRLMPSVSQPHQTYKYMQLTDNTDCNGNVGCEIAETEVEGTFLEHQIEKHPLTSVQAEA
jgi:hypothetical protein